MRGDVSAISYNLNLAYEKGMLKNKEITTKFLTTISNNLTVKPKGKRYDNFTNQFYEVLKIYGGPKIAKFVSANLEGPSGGKMKSLSRNCDQYQ